MTIYKEKFCVLCKLPFLPTSPKQKYCDLCKEEGRKIADRKRDLKRNRIRNNSKEFSRRCKICGEIFTTFYKSKFYCGSDECNKKRMYKNNKIAQSKRIEYNRIRNRKRYKEKNKEVLFQKAMFYRKQHPEAKDYIFGAKPSNHSIEYIRNYIEEREYKLVSDNYSNNRSKIELICPEGHLWETTFHRFQDRNTKNNVITGARCFECYIKGNYVSRPEQKIRDYFLNNYPNIEIVYNDRKQIHPQELDIYFPKHNLALEICGLYWHSEEAGKKPNYHYNKTIKSYEKGIRLITIFEDEIYNKFDIVISRILQALHLTPNKIFARKCVVKDIENKEANLFLDKNHIQGRSNSIKSFGLFYNDELVSVATIGKINRKHTSTGDTIELKRFCTLNNTMVIGGAQKLFKYIKEFAKNDGYTIIKSFCDMRYANIFNPVYENMGFSLAGQTKYSPHYVKNGVRYRNFVLKKTYEDYLEGKTESQLREEQGYDRVWDCGHRTYVYLIN